MELAKAFNIALTIQSINFLNKTFIDIARKSDQSIRKAIV